MARKSMTPVERARKDRDSWKRIAQEAQHNEKGLKAQADHQQNELDLLRARLKTVECIKDYYANTIEMVTRQSDEARKTAELLHAQREALLAVLTATVIVKNKSEGQPNAPKV